MAAVLCLACALFAGGAAWVLAGGTVRAKGLAPAYAQLLLHRVGRVVNALGESAPVTALLQLEDVALLVRMASTRAEARGIELPNTSVAVLLLLGGFGLVTLGGLFSQSVVGAVVVLGMLCAGVRMFATTQRQRRATELAEAMPGVLRTMATALSSGQTLVQAVEYVGLHEQGPVAEPFARASLRLRSGMSLDSALKDLRHELAAPGVELMVTALSISQRTGSPLRDLLQRAAELVEQQEGFERMLMVRTAQVRLSIRIVCLLPPVMVCVLALLSPDFQAGILTPVGMGSLIIAACMDALALFVVHRIMRGVL